VVSEEQGREMSLSLGMPGVEVGLSRESVEAMVDALIGNVVSHTEPGADLWVSVGVDRGCPWLEVSDAGPGFASKDLVGRGVSGAGSTGLGLDIVRRSAESVDGSLEVSDRPGGGAVVRVWLGPAV
jgi:signal transduction histidine kinase